MTTIPQVLARLEVIIAWAKAHQSPLGYFATIYWKMTLAVQEGIQQGLFEDGPRMERLDVCFAQRYLDAFEAWHAQQPCTNSWCRAFEAARRDELCVMQHILLGINAHINLDLGIAAAQTCEQDDIYSLRHDFDRINDLIAGLTDRVQDRLTDIWLPFGWLDSLLRTRDEGLNNFNIHVARGAAWKAATALAFVREKELQQSMIRELDGGINFIAQKITAPGRLISTGLYFMRRGERGLVGEKIDLLKRI